MKLIIDCDTGVDDAQAIMMALGRPDVELLGITCVSGNARVDQAVKNTFRVLKAWNRLDVPVFRGASSSLLEVEWEAYTAVHGTDGLGDVLEAYPEVDQTLVQDEHAVLALTRLAREHSGEVCLVCLGPLTNVALALKIDQNFGGHLKNVVILGGSIEGHGNNAMSMSAEFNFAVDPEAAHLTLKCLGCPITLIPWETCITSSVEWETYKKVLMIDTARGKFHTAITAKEVQFKSEEEKLDGYSTADPIAMLVAIDQKAILKSRSEYGVVELKGEITRGNLCIGHVDWRGYRATKKNLTIVCKVDMRAFTSMLVNALSE